MIEKEKLKRVGFKSVDTRSKFNPIKQLKDIKILMLDRNDVLQIINKYKEENEE